MRNFIKVYIIFTEAVLAAAKKKKGGKSSRPDYKWIALIFLTTVLISALMSFVSSNLLDGAGLFLSFGILIGIVLIGIIFDIIGVAVTAADEKPFHSMASRKVPEATQALKLIRNAGRVSSFCNDVIGDICGVISGSASAVIAARAIASMDANGRTGTIVTLALSALVAGLTVGGKALGKTVAMGSSVQVVRTTAGVLHFFRTIFQKIRRG